MSGLLIAITVIFFAVGIAFGVITTLALSAVRADRRARPDYGLQVEPQDEADHDDGFWSESAARSDQDASARDDGPRWPGDVDTGFRNRQTNIGRKRR